MLCVIHVLVIVATYQSMHRPQTSSSCRIYWENDNGLGCIVFLSMTWVCDAMNTFCHLTRCSHCKELFVQKVGLTSGIHMLQLMYRIFNWFNKFYYIRRALQLINQCMCLLHWSLPPHLMEPSQHQGKYIHLLLMMIALLTTCFHRILWILWLFNIV